MESKNHLFALTLLAIVLTLGVGAAEGADKASNPIPANGSAMRPEYWDDNVFMVLDYTPGDSALANGHTAYFSGNFDHVTDRDPAHCLGSVPPWPTVSETGFVVGFDDPGIPEYARAPLVVGQTYYWCIDEFDGQNTWPGDVWSFTVMGENAWRPTPADGAAGVDGDPSVTLSWELGDVDTAGYALKFHVYYGTNSAAVEDGTAVKVEAGYAERSVTVGPLAGDTVYYWRVDTVLEMTRPPFGQNLFTGDIWQFTTGEGEPPVDDPVSGIEVLEPGYKVEVHASYSADGIGSSNAATLDTAGNLYLVHQGAGCIWRVSPEGLADEFVCGLTSPRGIEWGGGTSFGDYLYLVRYETWGGGVYRIGLDSSVSNFADMISRGHAPTAIGLDNIGNYGGNIYVGTGGQDRTYQVTPSRSVSLWADFPGWTDGGAPYAIAFAPEEGYAGRMYMATAFSQANAHLSGLFTLTTAGAASKFSPDLAQASRIEFDFDGSFGRQMYVMATGGYGEDWYLWRVDPDGAATKFAATTLSNLAGFAFGPDGAMYVAEYDGDIETAIISKITKADTALVAHWKFDEDEGSIAYDSAGNNHGTIIGAAWADGYLGSALDFDGVDDAVSIPDSDVFDFGNGNFSVCAWVKTTDSSDRHGPFIVDIRQNDNDPHIELYASRGRIGAHLLPSYSRLTGPFMADGEWHHTALTLDNGASYGYRIHLDGTNVGERTYSGTFGDWDTFAIGARDAAGSIISVFDGSIDDVRIYNRALSDADVAELHSEVPPQTNPLVAHWKFDEGQGSIAHDSAGNNDGTIFGAAWADGLLGGALDFDGADDKVDVPDAPSLDIDSEITISSWIRPDKVSGMQFILGKWGSPESSRSYGCRLEDAHPRFFLGQGDLSITKTYEDLNVRVNEWNYAAFTWDGTTMKAYVDGVSSSETQPLSEYINMADAILGIGYNPGTSNPPSMAYFNGTMDDIRIYNRALTAAELEELYGSKPDTGPVGHWKFDEGEGSVAHDSAGDNDGTIYGAAWADGIFDGALHFDGLGADGVFMESSENEDSPLNIYNTDLTISAWVKSEGSGTLVARARPHRITYRLGISGQSAYLGTYRGATHWIMYSDSVVGQGDWHHVAGVFDRAERRGLLYVDGREEGYEVLGSDPPADGGITKIGCRNDTADFPFTGSIDDVRIYDRVLSAAEIEELYGARSEEGLVGHWKFDEGDGSVAHDSAGDNDGTIYGATWAEGILGGALDFDGDMDYVEIPDDDSLTPSDAITISWWVATRGEQSAGIRKYAYCPNESHSPGNSRAYGFHMSESGIALRIASATNTSDQISKEMPISTNEWHHAVATFDRGHAALYVDGDLVAADRLSVSSIMNDVHPLIIGGCWSYCGEDHFVSYLNGLADDVRIYDRSLNAGEIEDLYYGAFNTFLTEFNVVRKERVGRTVFEYECEVTLKNVLSYAVENVSLDMVECPANMTIIEPHVSFAGIVIEPGESATSLDTCTFTVDRSTTLDPAEIIWLSRAHIAKAAVTMDEIVSTPAPHWPPPNADFEGLADIACHWLWTGTPGDIEADTVPDGKINLADFAKFAQQWKKE